MARPIKASKELVKELKKVKRAVVKKVKLKSKDWAHFTRAGEYLICYTIRFYFPNNLLSFKINTTIKPYIFDDIFWEVFDMASNSNEPESLRAVGAFTVDGLSLPSKYVKEDWEMNNLDLEKVEEKVYETLSEIHAKTLELIDSFETIEDFYSYAVENGLQRDNYDLTTMLLLIYQKKYDQALQMAEKLVSEHKTGKFKNGDKWINEYIVDYCKERIGK